MYQVILQSKIVLLALHIYCFEMRSPTAIALVCPCNVEPSGLGAQRTPTFPVYYVPRSVFLPHGSSFREVIFSCEIFSALLGSLTAIDPWSQTELE